MTKAHSDNRFQPSRYSSRYLNALRCLDAAKAEQSSLTYLFYNYTCKSKGLQMTLNFWMQSMGVMHAKNVQG